MNRKPEKPKTKKPVSKSPGKPPKKGVLQTLKDRKKMLDSL